MSEAVGFFIERGKNLSIGTATMLGCDFLGYEANIVLKDRHVMSSDPHLSGRDWLSLAQGRRNRRAKANRSGVEDGWR